MTEAMRASAIPPESLQDMVASQGTGLKVAKLRGRALKYVNNNGILVAARSPYTFACSLLDLRIVQPTGQTEDDLQPVALFDALERYTAVMMSPADPEAQQQAIQAPAGQAQGAPAHGQAVGAAPEAPQQAQQV